MFSFSPSGRTPLVFVLTALFAACAEPAPTDSIRVDQLTPMASQAGLGSSVNQDLATLRRATAQFQRFDAAKDAGMGFHYGYVKLIDGSVQVDQPELLLYEPEKNGRLRLVAVEYIIPYTFHSRSAEPPVLFGQQFTQNDTFQLWGLHAWVWEENPSGMFASWNPRVTCANATEVMAMSHP